MAALGRKADVRERDFRATWSNDRFRPEAVVQSVIPRCDNQSMRWVILSARLTAITRRQFAAFTSAHNSRQNASEGPHKLFLHTHIDTHC